MQEVQPESFDALCSSRHDLFFPPTPEAVESIIGDQLDLEVDYSTNIPVNSTDAIFLKITNQAGVALEKVTKLDSITIIWQSKIDGIDVDTYEEFDSLIPNNIHNIQQYCDSNALIQNSFVEKYRKELIPQFRKSLRESYVEVLCNERNRLAAKAAAVKSNLITYANELIAPILSTDNVEKGNELIQTLFNAPRKLEINKLKIKLNENKLNLESVSDTDIDDNVEYDYENPKKREKNKNVSKVSSNSTDIEIRSSNNMPFNRNENPNFNKVSSYSINSGNQHSNNMPYNRNQNNHFGSVNRFPPKSNNFYDQYNDGNNFYNDGNNFNNGNNSRHRNQNEANNNYYMNDDRFSSNSINSSRYRPNSNEKANGKPNQINKPNIQITQNNHSRSNTGANSNTNSSIPTSAGSKKSEVREKLKEGGLSDKIVKNVKYLNPKALLLKQ